MIKRIKIFYANCYLLSGKNGSILVDTCNYKDGPKILKRIGNKEVKLILLTHGHFDHISSANYISKRLNVPIAMSREDLYIIGNGQASILRGHTLMGRIMAFFSQRFLKISTYSFFNPDVLLEDGQDLSEYGVNAHVIALPGHTKGSLGVLTDEGEFVVGDAMFNIIRPTGSKIYEDREVMENSVEKIRKSGAKKIYVGHGRPFSN